MSRNSTVLEVIKVCPGRAAYAVIRRIPIALLAFEFCYRERPKIRIHAVPLNKLDPLSGNSLCRR